jgi:hypothetical protein
MKYLQNETAGDYRIVSFNIQFSSTHKYINKLTRDDDCKLKWEEWHNSAQQDEKDLGIEEKKWQDHMTFEGKVRVTRGRRTFELDKKRLQKTRFEQRRPPCARGVDLPYPYEINDKPKIANGRGLKVIHFKITFISSCPPGMCYNDEKSVSFVMLIDTNTGNPWFVAEYNDKRIPEEHKTPPPQPAPPAKGP